MGDHLRVGGISLELAVDVHLPRALQLAFDDGGALVDIDQEIRDVSDREPLLAHEAHAGCQQGTFHAGLGPLLVGQVEPQPARSEEHTSELQSLMRISYAVFCLKKKKKK